MKLAYFGKILTSNDLQEKIISATFLAEDDDEMIEDSEIEEVEYDLNIIECFDIENIDYENKKDNSDSLSSVDKVGEDSENLNNMEGEYSVSENLPIALRKT
ncbi:5708_t:CDS:2, partial [Scutellospora calospora]